MPDDDAYGQICPSCCQLRHAATPATGQLPAIRPQARRKTEPWPSKQAQITSDLCPSVEGRRETSGGADGVPAFKVRGKAIAGFAAFKNHLSYLPHSGSVFPRLHDELKGYTTSSGALRFGIDEPLPVPLVEKLIAVRLQQAFPA